MPKKYTTEEFITKANITHNNKYDYSLVDYKGSKTKVKIICKKHGIFSQMPYSHLRQHGCPKCKEIKKYTTEEFIVKANLIHNNKYNYSLVDYKGSKTKVKIICEKHGVFIQYPFHHLNQHGCPKCANVKKLTTEEFIKRSKLVHDNKYDYSLVNYINAKTKVKIICEKHGIFSQMPFHHMNNVGCSKCANVKRSTTEEFIDKAKLIHQKKYDYSLVNYINNKTKVKIICKKHGVFEQKPIHHLNYHGCPICKSSRGENKIYNYLIENNIEFEREKKFKDLGNKRFDFYLPNLNTCIEFDGEQHFKEINFFGGKKGLEQIETSDLIKNQYCEYNNIKIIRISYTDYDNVYNIMNSLLM